MGSIGAVEKSSSSNRYAQEGTVCLIQKYVPGIEDRVAYKVWQKCTARRRSAFGNGLYGLPIGQPVATKTRNLFAASSSAGLHQSRTFTTLSSPKPRNYRVKVDFYCVIGAKAMTSLFFAPDIVFALHCHSA